MDGLVLGNFAPLEGETVSVVNGHLAQAEAQVKQERSTPETFSLGEVTQNSLAVDSQLSQATVSGEAAATYDLTTSQFLQEILVDPTTETLPPIENPPLVSEQTTTTGAALEDEEEEDESQGKENNEQNIAIEERPLRKNNKALSSYVRDMCQERLDLDLPLSVQPNEGIEEIVSACLHKFPGVEADLARRRVRIFLKNSRKGKRKPSTDKGLDDDPDDVYHPPPRKRRGRKRGGGGPDLPPSQWSVLSLTEFLNYNCPACDFKCKDQAKFLEHAYETHVDSVKYLCSVDLDDNHYAGGHGADDVDFQEDFVWNANSMSSIKEELTAASWDAATHQDDDDLGGGSDGVGDDTTGSGVETKPKVKVESGETLKTRLKVEGGSFSCQHCSKTFPTSNKLTRHLKKAHGEHSARERIQRKVLESDDIEKKFPCLQCSAVFVEKYRLDRHVLNVHEKVHNYICDKCTKTFNSANKLKRHVMSVHDQIRRHLCDKCDKTFTAPHELRAHNLVHHENVKEFQCDKCPRAYGYKRDLLRHVLTVHETPQFKCDRCDRAFPEQCMLNRHILQIHEGQKRHKCDQCDKTFLTPGDCKRHKLSIHDGIKCEVCDICHKGFALRGNLTAHYKKVHKMTPNYKEKEFQAYEKAPQLHQQQQQQQQIVVGQLPPPPYKEKEYPDE